MRIEPTVGRVVHYHPAPDHPDHGQTLTALICMVHDDGTVNLEIFDSCGNQFSRQRVPLIQGDDEVCVGAQYCAWMPFQLGQAEAHGLDGPAQGFDDLIDGTSKVYQDAPTTEHSQFGTNPFSSDLPPNAGWVRNAAGDGPNDQFDERGVPIAGIPSHVLAGFGTDIPVLGDSLAVSGDKPTVETSPVSYLPVWKANDTPAERLRALADQAERYPEAFAQFVLVHMETVDTGHTRTKYHAFALRTTEAIGVLEIAKLKLHRDTNG